MMNIPSAAGNACDEFPYVSPSSAHPPSLLPIMEQESSLQQQREHQLGYNLEANSLALLPPSNAHQQTTIAGHDILQFYPATASSHYLTAAGSNHYFGGGAAAAYQSYYPQAAQATPEYYFPTLVSSAEENMASFAATQLGLNLGYRTYFPPRGGYTYGHHPPRCQAEGCKADLSSAKRYHRRHKVCEHHSKAPVVVTAGGLHQRFCQQCSRLVLGSTSSDDPLSFSLTCRLLLQYYWVNSPTNSHRSCLLVPSLLKKKMYLIRGMLDS